MDVVTVTTSKHINAMMLQAYSLNKFLEEPCTHWVIIEDEIYSKKKWEQLLKPIYTKHNLVVVYSPISVSSFNTLGWIRQQVFKFTIANLIPSDVYYILDTKNILIKPTNFSKWDVDEGNNTIQFKNAPGFDKWTPWIDYSADLLSMDNPESFWSPETPFKVKTSVVKTLLANFNMKKVFFENKTDLSEFILYRFFSSVEPKGPTGPNGYGNINLSFWSTDKLIKPFQIKSILDKDPNISILSIHHACIVDQSSLVHEILDWLVTDLNFDPKYIKPLKLTSK